MGNRLNKLEICIESLDAGITAARAGADRLEVNQALSLGGLTPSVSLIKLLKEYLDIPLIAMIRTRHGYFNYTNLEYKTMIYSAKAMLDSGADGIAFGFIGEDMLIDSTKVSEFVKIAEGRETVFHRAFDLLDDQIEGMKTLIDLGVTRILSSGGEPSAILGKYNIKKLVKNSNSKIEILPAGGIRPHNAKSFIEYTGVNQIHSSCLKKNTDSKLTGYSLEFCDSNINDKEMISVDQNMVKLLVTLKKEKKDNHF